MNTGPTRWDQIKETFLLSGMCSPLSIDQTKSNCPSGNGWFNASATWKETCNISFSIIIFFVIKLRCFNAWLKSVSRFSCEIQLNRVEMSCCKNNRSFSQIRIWTYRDNNARAKQDLELLVQRNLSQSFNRLENTKFQCLMLKEARRLASIAIPKKKSKDEKESFLLELATWKLKYLRALPSNPWAAASSWALCACTGLRVMPWHLAPYFLARYLELPPIPHPTSTIFLGCCTESSAKFYMPNKTKKMKWRSADMKI